MLHPSFIHPPVMKLQAKPRKSGIAIPPEIPAGWGLPCRGAAEAQGAAISRRAAARTTVL